METLDLVQTGVALHLHSGIPVVNLEGDWNETTDRLLMETVTRLAGFGHFEIIVNLSRATRLTLPERTWLDRLEMLASVLRRRCGRLDVVGSRGLVQECLKQQAHSLLRWAASEEEAICRIKGVPCLIGGLKLSSHFAS